LAILCIMAYWVLLDLRVLSAVGGLRMEFSSLPRNENPRHQEDA